MEHKSSIPGLAHTGHRKILAIIVRYIIIIVLSPDWLYHRSRLYLPRCSEQHTSNGVVTELSCQAERRVPVVYSAVIATY